MAETNISQVSDWFEPLYAQAAGDTSQVPWELPGAVPYLTDWLAQNAMGDSSKGTGQEDDSRKSAVVVGCGLGDDAEALAQAGFLVTAFDVSESAIAWAKKRFPSSTVNYIVADLFQLPANWRGAFDLVFDFRTIQALPLSVRTQVIENIAALAGPNGTVLVMTYLRASDAQLDGPPWPLSLKELAQFEAAGLEVVESKRYRNKASRFSDRIQMQYRAPQSPAV